MPSDTSMPPSDPNDMPAGGMPSGGDMGGAPMGAPQDGGDGSVMMQMPKPAFDAIHQLVVQLASALDAAAGQVNDQKAQAEGGAPAGAPPMPPGAGAPPMAPGAGAPPAGPSQDDQDLANFAQQLSARNR